MKFLQKSLVSATITAMLVGTLAVASLAATNTGNSAPAANKSTTAAASTTAKTQAPKISQDQAVKIALAAHKGATLIKAKLVGKIYEVRIQTPKAKRLVQVGSKSGKILSDTLVKEATSQSKPSTSK